jgi:ABC-type transport system substrate-binding protein
MAILLLSNTVTINVVSTEIENPNAGPYVDTVNYIVNSDLNGRILSLQAGDLDAILEPIDPTHLSTLEADPDIGIYSIPHNGYGLVTINCRKYPLNISAFRRAIAYALDKNRVVSEVKDNHATSHDSVFPLRSSWCIEEDLPYHYYSNQSDIGNQILDDLGFTIDSGTNLREFPNGTTISLTILTMESGVPDILRDAFDSLHIASSLDGVGSPGLLFNVKEYYPNYDMAYFQKRFYKDDPDTIFTDYLSDYADVSYFNQYQYENETFDSLVDDFHSSVTYEEVFEAVSAIQKHLHENVPSIIVFEGIDYQACRTAELTGHVEDDYWGIMGPWTNVKVHSKTGNPFGGVYDIAVSIEPSGLNPFVSINSVSIPIMSNLYSGLYKVGPDNEPYADLAMDTIIENHAKNPSVPEGQTWITVDIVSNAVWSDGEPLTADDVAFTFMYINESKAYGNPHAYHGWTNDYLSSEVLAPHKARIVLESESYYHIQQVLREIIIPEHFFNEATGVGFDGWSYAVPLVTCGPFYVSDYNSSAVELSMSLDYHWPSGLAPKILASTDINYIQGTTGNQIVWEVTDEDPNDYTILQNGSLEETDDWNGSDITHSVDGLAVGSYNYTLVLTDISGHIVTDTVWVTVTPAQGSMSDMMTLGIIGGAVVVILIVAVIVTKKH